MNGGYEELNVEGLGQKLEEIQKDNETIRRENSLYESYINRNQKHEPIENEDEAKEAEKRQKTRKRGQQQVQEVKTLSLQEKHDIATAELEELKKSIQEGQKKSEELLEWLKAVLDEIDINIAEIKREAHEFKRDIVLGSENSRTGKIVAEKLIKYIEERIRLKDTIISKNHENNQKLNRSIAKEKLKIMKKEQANDDLQFIDFHQLQIENKKLVRDIDERNKQLLSLKVTSGKSTQRLTHIKDMLSKEEKKLKELTQEIEDADYQTDTNMKNIQKVKKMTKIINRKQKRYKQQKNESENLPSVSDYIDLKNEESQLLKQVSTLERKIIIAEPGYDKALKILNKPA
ncbi:hypothetical protein SteCoe_15971 [Stentor coeruleus]|uniref:Cilia- and flagella-associated protein 263 n=1 Tax=Stentor coeruleus TaxID=5963 RepID=A0A1R2C2K6_9CILI|nr:hypothetical protein SteCoe_15971 [Stentor coeruleus]